MEGDLFVTKRYSFNIDCILLVPPFTCKEALQAWQEKNYRWLELSDVHKETTNNVRVTVMPFFMGVKVSSFKFL